MEKPAGGNRQPRRQRTGGLHYFFPSLIMTAYISWRVVQHPAKPKNYFPCQSLQTYLQFEFNHPSSSALELSLWREIRMHVHGFGLLTV